MYDILLWKKGAKLMSLLWTAVVLFVGMIFGIWLTKIMLPTGKLLIDRTKDNKNVMTFSLGSLDPDELVKHKVMLIRIKEVTQK